jgi:hypothetical protein
VQCEGGGVYRGALYWCFTVLVYWTACPVIFCVLNCHLKFKTETKVQYFKVPYAKNSESSLNFISLLQLRHVSLVKPKGILDEWIVHSSHAAHMAHFWFITAQRLDFILLVYKLIRQSCAVWVTMYIFLYLFSVHNKDLYFPCAFFSPPDFLRFI